MTALFAVVGIAIMQADPQEPFVFGGKVSELKLAASALGDGWKGPSGLVVDDIDNLSALSDAERAAVEPLIPQLRKGHITAIADFTYNRVGRVHSVTIRVFAFRSPDDAVAFATERWSGPKFKDRYQLVEGVGDEAVDHKSGAAISKRYVRLGNLIFSATELPSGDTHVKVLDKMLAGIRE